MSTSSHLRVDEDVLGPALNNAQLTNPPVQMSSHLAMLAKTMPIV